jgi:hypothetical protein
VENFTGGDGEEPIILCWTFARQKQDLSEGQINSFVKLLKHLEEIGLVSDGAGMILYSCTHHIIICEDTFEDRFLVLDTCYRKMTTCFLHVVKLSNATLKHFIMLYQLLRHVAYEVDAFVRKPLTFLSYCNNIVFPELTILKLFPAAAVERGGKVHLLHMQCMLWCPKINRSRDAVQQAAHEMVYNFAGVPTGQNYHVYVELHWPGDAAHVTWRTMVGYVFRERVIHLLHVLHNTSQRCDLYFS